MDHNMVEMPVWSYEQVLKASTSEKQIPVSTLSEQQEMILHLWIVEN